MALLPLISDIEILPNKEKITKQIFQSVFVDYPLFTLSVTTFNPTISCNVTH